MTIEWWFIEIYDGLNFLPWHLLLFGKLKINMKKKDWTKLFKHDSNPSYLPGFMFAFTLLPNDLTTLCEIFLPALIRTDLVDSWKCAELLGFWETMWKYTTAALPRKMVYSCKCISYYKNFTEYSPSSLPSIPMHTHELEGHNLIC